MKDIIITYNNQEIDNHCEMRTNDIFFKGIDSVQMKEMMKIRFGGCGCLEGSYL